MTLLANKWELNGIFQQGEASAYVQLESTCRVQTSAKVGFQN